MSLSLKRFDFDVAISFAGENRNEARKLANFLKLRGIEVFFDEYFKADLWGKDLYQHLQTVYKEKARYCIILVSKEYKEKLWTKHELRSAQERALNEINNEYILPIRVDDTILPGLPESLGFINLKESTFAEVADLFSKKIGFNIDDSRPDDFYQLINLNIHTEIDLCYSSIKMSSRANDLGLEKENIGVSAAEGQNPVESVINVVQKLTGIYPEIQYFRYKSELDEEFKQISYFSISIKADDTVAIGSAKDTDLARTACLAFINALNNLKRLKS